MNEKEYIDSTQSSVYPEDDHNPNKPTHKKSLFETRKECKACAYRRKPIPDGSIEIKLPPGNKKAFLNFDKSKRRISLYVYEMAAPEKRFELSMSKNNFYEFLMSINNIVKNSI